MQVLGLLFFCSGEQKLELRQNTLKALYLLASAQFLLVDTDHVLQPRGLLFFLPVPQLRRGGKPLAGGSCCSLFPRYHLS